VRDARSWMYQGGVGKGSEIAEGESEGEAGSAHLLRLLRLILSSSKRVRLCHEARDIRDAVALS